MSKIFQGNVSIIINTKGQLSLKKDNEGRFSAENAAECLQVLRRLSKQHKLAISQYALFQVENGTEPVLLANRFGQPYLALLPKREASGSGGRRVKKLA